MTTPASIEIHGHCDERFARVREALARNFVEAPEVGAAVAVSVDGVLVIDLWAGHADRDRTRPWERDTIVNVYSATKGLAALAAHMLADRGQLDFDAPVTRYWPEFGQAGKETMPVRYLLTHQTGLTALEGDPPLDIWLDWDAVCAHIAKQRPRWLPGTRHGYQRTLFGHLVGEVVRRIDGRTIGTFVRDEIADPLDVDFFIGTPASEDHRIADTLPDTRTPPPPGAVVSHLTAVDWNTRARRAAEIPSSNGHTNARALAVTYGALACGGEANGVRLLSERATRLAAAEVAAGMDETLKAPTHRTLGFMLPVPGSGDARPAGSWGHAGAGGSQGFADPARRLGFGYTMNQMLMPQPGEARPVPGAAGEQRAQRVLAALYGAL